MTGRWERQRKEAKERGERVGWMFGREEGRAFDRWPTKDRLESLYADMMQSGYSPWTGKWFRAPPADRPFATDVDGTIILHPSQWKVIA